MTAPRLSEILNEKKEPTYRQAQKIATDFLIRKKCTFLRKDRKSHINYKEMCNIFHIDHP